MALEVALRIAGGTIMNYRIDKTINKIKRIDEKRRQITDWKVV